MARAHKIGLVSKVWNLCRQIRIPGTLWLVAPRTSMSKVIAAQDTIDGPKWWQGPDVLFLEFLQDGLSTTKLTLIVETEAGYLDDLLNPSGRSLRLVSGDLDLSRYQSGSSRSYRSSYLYNHGRVRPRETQMLSGLSPSRYRLCLNAVFLFLCILKLPTVLKFQYERKICKLTEFVGTA